MSTLVSAVLTDFCSIFNDCGATKQLELWNAAHSRICKTVKLYPDDIVNVPLTASLPTSAFDPNILRVWQANLVQSATQIDPLTDSSVDENDAQKDAWRSSPVGTVSEWMDEGPVIRWNPTPDTSSATLAISGATNASPIVVTSATHGIDGTYDGFPSQAVTISGVVGNTAANGSFYAKVTGYSTTTFALYLDQALTIPVAGNGAYSSGGTLTTSESYPYVQLVCSKRRVLATTDLLPLQLDDYDAWTDLMCLQWARRRHSDREAEFIALSRRSMNELKWKVMGRQARLKPEVHSSVPSILH